MVSAGQQFRGFCLGFFLLITTLPAAYGGTPTLLFQSIDEAKGLPDSTVFQVMQDHKGAMWFGTRNGVARYDGISMKVFQNEDDNPQSLSHNDAGGVMEDRTGAIWVRTWGGGFNRLDPATEKFQAFRHNPSDPKSLSEDRVQTHYEDSQGVVWAGTFSKGLNRFERETETFTRFIASDQPGAISNNRIWSISETRDETLWVGTGGGLNRVNRTNETFTAFKHSPEDPSTLPHDEIRALYPAGGSTLWVGTPKGFRLFDTDKGRCIPFPGMDQLPSEVTDGSINTLYDDGRTLWVGTNDHGLLILDLETGQSALHQSVPYLANALSHNDIRWITEDRSGVIWLGTRGGGVSTLSKTFHQMHLFMPGYSGDDIPMSIHATASDDEGNLWTGSWYTGLGNVSSSGGPFKATGGAPPPLGPGSLDINALALDTDKNLWIGTWGAGLVVRDHQTGEFKSWSIAPDQPDKRNITALSVKKAGVIWAGTRSQGLFRHDLTTGDVRRFSEGGTDKGGLSSNTIHALLEDKKGNLWVGTNLGLDRIAKGGSPITQFHHRKKAAESLSNNIITCLAEAPNGGIWVGTYHGLNRLNPETETIRTYFMEDGLSGNIIKSLVFDGSRRLWVATDRGLSAIDIKNGNISRFPLPLRFVQGAASRSADGEVIFGGENGYLLFTPEEVPLTLPSASLHLTGLRLNGTPVQPGIPVKNRLILSRPLNETERIDLAHHENNLTFSFVLHDYNNTAENRYRYRLDGYDPGWVDAKNATTARYPHLPPGTYRFHVMAAGSQGAWNQSHPGIEIHISHPFWQRWYVQVAALLLVIGLIRLRFTNIANRNRELEQLVTERTRELGDQTRLYERLSLTDPLTELMNRRGVQKREKELRSQARRNQSPYAMILVDVDHFKPINDKYGHDCGDFVLQRLSRLLESSLRIHDVIGRWGGEEFLILLPDTDEKGAETLADRLRSRISSSLFEWNEAYLTVTLTLGVVNCALEETFEQSIGKVDAALYQGKEGGRNQVVVAKA